MMVKLQVDTDGLMEMLLVLLLSISPLKSQLFNFMEHYLLEIDRDLNVIIECQLLWNNFYYSVIHVECQHKMLILLIAQINLWNTLLKMLILD